MTERTGKAMTVNIHQAKTQLSRLVEDAASGQEIIIAKAGRPVARLVSLAAPVRQKRLGLLRGKIRIAPEFDAPLPDDLLDAFEGKRR
jgi:prevent-host-death family protein